MRIVRILAALMALILVAPGEAAAHGKSRFFFGVTLGPIWYGPPTYYYGPPVAYYPPPPPVYYPPAPAVVYSPDCRPVQGRGEETGRIYEGIACRQPDGSWRVTPR